MADNVHVLRPKDRPERNRYAELQRQRTAMIGAWTEWLASEPEAGDVLQEIHATTVAMRSLADLMAMAAGRHK